MSHKEWDIFKKSVDPLKKKSRRILIDKKKNMPTLEDPQIFKNDDLSRLDITSKDERNPLEKNVLKKILSGKIKIANSLDLHGYTVNESKKLVLDFVNNNYKLQKRLILIICGKGKRLSVDFGWKGIGKLKANVPSWLNSVILCNKILWFDHAPPNKGGEGAFLVYLKKATK